MSRRQFLSLLGAAFVLPPRLSAAQPAQIRRIGMLIGYAENDPETQARLAAFRQGLDHLGWREGRNVHIDYRFAPASPDQAQLFAKELVGLRPDVLVGNSTPATAALLNVTRTIPVVFVGVSDPVGSGFVTSIARPGRSSTGFTNFEPSLNSASAGNGSSCSRRSRPASRVPPSYSTPRPPPAEGRFSSTRSSRLPARSR